MSHRRRLFVYILQLILTYDLILTDIDDSVKDVKFVIAAYIYNGESVKYVQDNGLSDTVSGISYNEAKECVATPNPC